jgi:hypothetical protein
VVGVQMTSEGIDRRCLDLMFDATSGQHRFAEGEFGERSARPFMPSRFAGANSRSLPSPIIPELQTRSSRRQWRVSFPSSAKNRW